MTSAGEVVASRDEGMMKHPTWAELEAGMAHLRQAPKDAGILELIVRRPGVGEREMLTEGDLTVEDGLAGDSWGRRKSGRSPHGSPHPDMQLNIMSARAAQLVSQDRTRWSLAGDQLYVDLDLSAANLPPGAL